VLPGFDLARPIREVMTTEPFSMPETASAYDATLEMAAHKLRHMLVVNSEGRLTGVVSERDLFSLQRISLRQVRASIEGASSIDALQRASKDIRQLALNLVAQGIAAEQLTRFIFLAQRRTDKTHPSRSRSNATTCTASTMHGSPLAPRGGTSRRCRPTRTTD
jgi:Predicted signal-transduction protein containing cAMP-binding and CBS domains